MADSFLYALISMLFAGANDTLFKKQAVSGNSQSHFMMIAGMVWSSVFIFSAILSGNDMPTWLTIRWTFTIGALSACANYLLIYSMRRLEAGVASTIYRLNLAIAAIIAFVFLSESINMLKVAGLIFACLSVFSFARHQQISIPKGAWLVLSVVLTASFLRAVYGVSYKVALTNGVQYLWFLSGPGLGWMVLGSLVSYNKGSMRISRNTLIMGIISGFLLCGLVFFFAKALKEGQASIIIPVSQMSFVVTAILAYLFLGEKFNLRKIIGLCCACLSILLLSQSG